MDVGKVNFDDMAIKGIECVMQRHGCVGQAPCIDDKGTGFPARLVDGVNQVTFVIALAKVDLKPQRQGMAACLGFDIGQGLATINLWFPVTEQVEIWAIEDEDRCGHD